jgi:DNA-binding transcriptional regulator LsrR (DeoR family)
MRSTEPSLLLQRNGKALDPGQQAVLMQLEAVGDVCVRFFDQNGNLINSSFNDRVLEISPKQLKAVPGGLAWPADPRSSRWSCQGGWINTLIIDLNTARGLRTEAGSLLPPTVYWRDSLFCARFMRCRSGGWRPRIRRWVPG